MTKITDQQIHYITDQRIHDFILDEFLSWTHRHERTLHNLAETACQHFDDYKEADTFEKDVEDYMIPDIYFSIAYDIMNSFEDSSQEDN